jgi:hypothetical protein
MSRTVLVTATCFPALAALVSRVAIMVITARVTTLRNASLSVTVISLWAAGPLVFVAAFLSSVAEMVFTARERVHRDAILVFVAIIAWFTVTISTMSASVGNAAVLVAVISGSTALITRAFVIALFATMFLPPCEDLGSASIIGGRRVTGNYRGAGDRGKWASGWGRGSAVNVNRQGFDWVSEALCNEQCNNKGREDQPKHPQHHFGCVGRLLA